VAAWDDPSILSQWQATYGFQTALVAADSPLRKYFESHEAWQITSQTNEAILYEQQPAPPAK
jgi:hypothetical protein